MTGNSQVLLVFWPRPFFYWELLVERWEKMKILETFTYQKPLQAGVFHFVPSVRTTLFQSSISMENGICTPGLMYTLWYMICFPNKEESARKFPSLLQSTLRENPVFWTRKGLVFPFLASWSTCWCEGQAVSYTRWSSFFTFQTSHLSDPSYPTLKKLAGRRPDIPIYVGKTERPVFWNLNQSGVQLTNINVVPFGIWQQVRYQCFFHTFQLYFLGVNFKWGSCFNTEETMTYFFHM